MAAQESHKFHIWAQDNFTPILNIEELNVTMHLQRLYTPYQTDLASYKTQ